MAERADEELQALCDAATPGPWAVGAFESGHSRYELFVAVTTAEMGDLICDMDGLSRSGNERDAKDDGYADARFIAAARSAVPSLLARVVAAEKKLAAVEAVADEWERKAGPRSRAWSVFGQQVISVPFAVEQIRAALADEVTR